MESLGLRSEHLIEFSKEFIEEYTNIDNDLTVNLDNKELII